MVADRKKIVWGFFLVLTIQAASVHAEKIPDKELKSLTKKIVDKIKVNPSCAFGLEMVQASIGDAIKQASLREIELFIDKGICTVTCVDFDSVNIVAKPTEILIDSNLDTSNASVSLSKKFLELIESTSSNEKK